MTARLRRIGEELVHARGDHRPDALDGGELVLGAAMIAVEVPEGAGQHLARRRRRGGGC